MEERYEECALATGSASEEQLVFGRTTQLCSLYDGGRQPVTLGVHAGLQGMFVLARELLDGGIDNNGSSNNNNKQRTESVLTCYRRNRFQVVGGLSLDAWPRWMTTKDEGHGGGGDNGDTDTHDESLDELDDALTAQLTAVETRDWTQVVILTGNGHDGSGGGGGGPAEISWTAAQCRPQQHPRQHGGFPPPAPLTVPFAWERLQFRAATANNGRKRRDIRQRFRVDVSVFATRKCDGARVCVARASSAPLTVRGRSPKNFEARDDQPLAMTMVGGRSPVFARPSSLPYSSHERMPPAGTGMASTAGHAFSYSGQQQQLAPDLLAAQPPLPAFFATEAPSLPPGLCGDTNSTGGSSSATNNNQLVYSPTMWDWMDLSAVAASTAGAELSLDRMGRGMSEPEATNRAPPDPAGPSGVVADLPGSASRLALYPPTVYYPPNPALHMTAVHASTDDYFTWDNGFSFAPVNPWPQVGLQPIHYNSDASIINGGTAWSSQPHGVPMDGSPSMPPPPRPPSPAVAVSTTGVTPAIPATPPSSVPSPDILPAAGPSLNINNEEAARSTTATTTASPSALEPPSTTTPVGDNDNEAPQARRSRAGRYTYIPVGLDGWLPPAEPVYWAHPWVHMRKTNFAFGHPSRGSRQCG
ncbi:NDT80 DNA-binding domain protein [Niveomyces insectorum RCEF 264]|uniref:NDT80 DNA-binding domain protein n=1 Tax=Niveomyces insectorum RCEF 264 TaxID=1081102 RepID=A0A162K567_9HYPO|nr:NDT80 DNA-binding domain protein [Niveomyces insectorum RCEF 264]